MDSSEIRSGARVVVDGLKARPELNGSSGTVGTLNEESGRWNVMIDDMREPLALKAASLSLDDKWAGIVVGTVVRLSGLEDKQEMYNGKLASVRSFAGEQCSVYETVAAVVDYDDTCDVEKESGLASSCLASKGDKNS